jgi:hypothetical protein
MAAEALTRHPSFRQLALRVHARWALHALRRGLVWGLAGAMPLTLVGRLAGWSDWASLALGWLALALVASIGIASLRRPDSWAVARAADALGLSERVTSSLYADTRSSSVAALIGADARRALGALQPSQYAVLDSRGMWRAVLAGAVLFALLLVLPIPQLSSDANRAAEAGRIVTAQQRVQAIEVQSLSEAVRSTPLGQRTTEELRALRSTLSRTDSSADAARALETTQKRLTQLPGSDDYAWRRSLDSVASTLESQQEQTLLPLARALRARDQQVVDQALSELAARLDQPGVSDAERSRLQGALQQAANAAATSQPRLAGALRRAASATGSGAAATDAELRDLLSEGVADAAALDSLDQSVADLSQLRATTLPVGARLVAATGTPTAYALIRGTPPPNATLVAIPVSGAGNGGSSGVGPQGSGPGGGAGYGDTPSQGRPSSSDAPTGGSTAGQRVAPNSAAAVEYDPVYAPSRLGGEGGPVVQAPGDATGATGAGVDLPQGPLTVGEVRPYNEVYAEYAQEARQSAARQSLPANVQTLVDRYFGSISPSTDTPQP